MKTILSFLLVFLSTAILAQTKVIAHKSHSGNKSTFSKACENSLFDSKSSNFGAAPVDIKRAQLDSLIFVNDTTQVMVTSIFCTDKNKEVVITKKWDSISQKRIKALGILEDKKTTLWEPGRDTVYNHELFSQDEGLSYIKTILKRQYNFENPVESVVFIGYSDNPNIKALENSSIFVNTENIQEDVVEVNITGRYLSDGSCGPFIFYGLDKKDDNGNWKTICNIDNQIKHKCGLPYVQHKKYKRKLSLNRLLWGRFKENIEIETGTYRLYARLYNTESNVYSNEFEIK